MTLNERLNDLVETKKPDFERVETVLHVGAKIEPKQLVHMEDVYKITYTARGAGEKEAIYTVPRSVVNSVPLPFSTVVQWIEAELSRVYKDSWSLRSVTRVEIEALSLPRGA